MVTNDVGKGGLYTVAIDDTYLEAPTMAAPATMSTMPNQLCI